MRRELGEVVGAPCVIGARVIETRVIGACAIGLRGAQGDGAVLRVIEAADAVQEAGFASSIGTDDGMNGPLPHRQRHLGQSCDAAETQRYVVDVQQRLTDRYAAGVEFVLISANHHVNASDTCYVNSITITDRSFPLCEMQYLYCLGVSVKVK